MDFAHIFLVIVVVILYGLPLISLLDALERVKVLEERIAKFEERK